MFDALCDSGFSFELPTLYARSNTGSVISWDIEVSGSSYRTITGQHGSQKKITSGWTVCTGKNTGKKNQTSDVQQAQVEADNKWKKKIKEGYFESINDIDKVSFYQPMLAHKYLDYKDDIDWSNGVYISPKMDGMRDVTKIDGAFSRNGNEIIAIPHILKKLEKIFIKYPSLVLDGELYTHKLKNNFNKIMSLAKKTKPTAANLYESEQFLEYWIFDCPTIDGGFHERYTWLHKMILKEFYNDRHIKLCIHKLITSPDEIEPNLQHYIEHGFEGLMLNTYKGEYEQKRSKNLLKYKLFIDDEFEVVLIEEGIGNRSGMFGNAKLMSRDGKVFDSSARGTEEQYLDIWKNKHKYIGKQATIRFQNYTPDGIPRFPVIVNWHRIDGD